MKLRLALFTMLSSFLFLANSQESNAPKFGKGLFNLVGQDSSWTMKIGTRIQFLATSNWQEGSATNTNFLIRRSRLKFDGYAFSPKLKYKFELGLSNRDMSGVSEFTRNTPRYIMDAVVKWNFYENFVLWIGQTKLPGNRERVISSANLQMVDRSLVNSRFNIDRDIGFQLRHHLYLSEKFLVREIFALSQGEGRNVTNGNLGGHQYTGRLEFLPFDKFTGKGDYLGSDIMRELTPKLSIGVTYDLNSNAVRTRSNLGRYMRNDVGFHETNTTTLFIDTMFKFKGFSLEAEYANREADDPIAINSDGTPTGDVVLIGDGINVQAGYLFKTNWEISGRYTSINFDTLITGRDAENMYTLGLSRFIVGHKLKVQSDLSLLKIASQNDQVMFRVQMDVHF